jgi:hypothetical protein
MNPLTKAHLRELSPFLMLELMEEADPAKREVIKKVPMETTSPAKIQNINVI